MWASCDVIQSSQMIVMGGEYTNKAIVECDSAETWGQHSLLLGQEGLESDTSWWARLLSNVTTYRVPDIIVAKIGGGYVSQKILNKLHADCR
jgi:hypothetical protein